MSLLCFDLSNVAEDRRAGVWALTAPSFFPGLSINDMPAAAPVGQIRSISMGGGGALWSILSAPVLVSYSPTSGADEAGANMSLMMQLDGTMMVGQNRRACELHAGDMCLIDERFPFHLQGRVRNEIVFLRMPRRAVLGRIPIWNTARPVRWKATIPAPSCSTTPWSRRCRRLRTCARSSAAGCCRRSCTCWAPPPRHGRPLQTTATGACAQPWPSSR